MEIDYGSFREPQRDYGQEVSIWSQNIERTSKEWLPKDVPDPIIYNDEWGKTIVGFTMIGKNSDGVKMYDIFYKHNKKRPVSLSQYLGNEFFFHWTSSCRFSVLGSDGTPAVFVDYHALQASRQHLFGLAHEIGHTHQRQVDRDLWSILGSDVTNQSIKQIIKKYPSLSDYAYDLVRVKNMSGIQDPNAIRELCQQVQHKPYNGFDTRGIDHKISTFADDMLTASVSEAPLGPTHLTQMFFGAILKHTLPGVYLILDAMGEQRAWEIAIEMEEEDSIHPGFQSETERVQYMLSGLDTYDRYFKTDAYTRWLESAE